MTARSLVLFAALCSLLAPSLAGSAPGAPTGIAARPLVGRSASQAWDFAAQLDSGHDLFVRFLITNIGPGESNAAAIWHLVEPDGGIREFRNGRREGEWRLEDAGYRLRIGSSVLTLRGVDRGFSIDKGKVQIHFRVRLPAEFEDEVATEGQQLGLVSLAAPLDGTFWFRGMEKPVATQGRAVVTQSFEARAGAALRRFDFLSFDRDRTLFVSEVLDERGSRKQWIWFGTPADWVRSDAVVVCDTSTGAYPIPKRLLGEIPAGQVVIQVEDPFLRYDPLSALPKAFRTVLAWFQRPMRLWARGTYGIDGTPKQGRGLARLTFNDSIPDSLRGADAENPACRRASAS